MLTRNRLLYIQTGLLLLTSGCAVTIHDFQACSPVPKFDATGHVIGSMGATCDNFLTANQQILTEQEWQALQASWNASGQAVECTNSGALAANKAEIEKLCSKTPCSYALKALIANLQRMIDIGQMSRERTVP